MDQQIARLFKKVRSGKAVLFLGAGASIGAGVPSGAELAHKIQIEFNLNNNTEDLIEACTKALDTAGIDRKDVEDFIRSQLYKAPSEAHKKLPLIYWQAIFTTNFDDLVETAYRNCPDRKQRCEPIFSAEFSRRQSDYLEFLRLFKLMGCINMHGEDSRMALNRSDYNRKLRHRGTVLKFVYDFVKDGTIIYIGYSFRDLIARDILDEVAEEVGLERLPWGWALLPEWDDDLKRILAQRKVLPIKMTIEDFLVQTLSTPSEPVDIKPFQGIYLTIAGIPIEIGEKDYKMYSREFQILHDEVGLDKAPDSVDMRRDYLEGKIDAWVGIAEKWAFVRPVCSEIQKLILANLDNTKASESPIILIRGPAGAGKSTVIRILSYSIYKEFGIPVIFLPSDNIQIDYVVIDAFSRQIEDGLTNAGKKNPRQPILIVVDEAAAHIQDIRRLAQYLKSRGIPAVLAAVARENEWKLALGEYHFSLAGEVNVSDRLDNSNREANELIHHLRRLGILVSGQDDNYWLMRIDREYENSFATTLYQLAEPTRPPLNQAIQDEYKKLSKLAQRAYRYICVFYQYNIPISLELLARSLNCSYERFGESVYDSATRGVIVEELFEGGDIIFRARSRLVAERIVSYAYVNSDWFNDVCAVIRSCLPHNSNEVKTVHNILIHRIGPRGAEPKELNLLIQAFQAALDAGIRDSAILHHFALLLSDQEEFDKAEEYALESLRILDDDQARPHFKTESHQNLNNTLGMILAKKALKQEKMGIEKSALEMFKRAVTYFRAARSGEFANAYPYYCESWMFYKRARSSDNSGAIMHIAKAFEVLDEAEGNVPEDDIATIKEMEAKLIQFLSEIQDLNKLLEDLRIQNGPTVSYLQARYSNLEKDDPYRKERAYSIVTESLKKSPNHIPCLRLASHLHYRIYPSDFSGWKALLERLYYLEEPKRCDTLFSLGYAACQLGDYNEAMGFFEQLERESIGHPRRSHTVQIVKDGTEERRLSGNVVSVRSRTEAWIRSEAFDIDLKCIPRAQKFTIQKGQAVSFVLALNYRGCLAIDLRPE